MKPLSIVFLGLSVTSSWGNGHAVTYRGLMAALAARGHRLLFLERDQPWYAAHRDLPDPPWGHTALYRSLAELEAWSEAVAGADLVVVGSFVPEGKAVGRWVLERKRGVAAFYDIDTPATLAGLQEGGVDYLDAALIPAYDLYLSFTGGPLLDLLERQHGARMARALYCSADTSLYQPPPGPAEPRWLMGYMGTYARDRQDKLEELLCDPARRLPDKRFIVAGPQYPQDLAWPGNVERVEHLAPAGHPAFYHAQAFTLNLTRAAMAASGWSPSIRLFEAAACATPVISDWWNGLDHFFEPGEEILIARDADEALALLSATPPERRRAIGRAARRRVLAAHTAAHRADQLLQAWAEARE